MGSLESDKSIGLLADLINVIPIALAVVNDKGSIVAINDQATSLLNLNPNCLGSNFNRVSKFVDDQHRKQKPLSGLIDQPQPKPSAKLFIKQSKQSYRPVLVSVKPIIGQNRQWNLVIIEDQTDDHQRNQSHNDFISTASHEMRTPLATIEGYLSLIGNQEACQIDDQARVYLKQAQMATNHLSRLSTDLLIASRSRTGHLVNEAVEVDLVQFIGDLIETTNFGHRQKRLKLKLTVNSKPLKRLVDIGDFQVLADPNRLSELFSNLLDNGVKYTKKGFVKVDLSRSETMVVVEVADSGCGLAESDIDHIFKQFYRVDNQELGTGLGLFIVKKIVDLYQGKIEVESRLGHGSRFLVHLPALNPKSEA